MAVYYARSSIFKLCRNNAAHSAACNRTVIDVRGSEITSTWVRLDGSRKDNYKMALPRFNFGQQTYQAFTRACQWIRNAYGQYDTNAVKPPVDYSFDNAFIMYGDKTTGQTAVPFMCGVDANNITQMLNPHGINQLSQSVTQAATPSAPTITPLGIVGSTNYSYKVVALTGAGQTRGNSIASAAGSTSTGASVLSTSNYNQLSIPAVPNVVGYDIYRTVGGATQGKIGTVPVLLNAAGLVQNAVIGSGVPQSVSNSLAANTASAVGTLLFNDPGLVADGTTA